MLSLITAIFTVLLLVPAVIIAFCVAELKSTLLPEIKDKQIIIHYEQLIVGIINIIEYDIAIL